jgi:hypothetical protein
VTDHSEAHRPQPHDTTPLPDVSEAGAPEAADAEGGGPPPPRIEGFDILEEVGRGGMGMVYRAYERRLRRVVALKVLDPAIAENASAAKRFRREAVLAANLNHPNIVPVFQVEPSATPRYFTMEFVEGRSVKQKVQREGHLAPDEAARIALQAAEALQYAHEHHILHRDVKPSNLLLQNHVERVRVTDFGIAQDVTGALAEVTQTESTSPGTPAFMSPEQNLGEPLDARTDVFSLGMTLYYMLTGRVAYAARNRQELAVAFRDRPAAPPSRSNGAVPPQLDAVVLRMIAVDPGRRYATAGEAARALRGYLDAAAASPRGQRGQPTAPALRRRARRRLLAAAAVLAAAALAWILHPMLKPDGPSPAHPTAGTLGGSPGAEGLANVALSANGGRASADSFAMYRSANGAPEHAIDGSFGLEATGWFGRRVPGWLQVEFDRVYRVRRVGVWLAAHRQKYTISLSRDGAAWENVVPPRTCGPYEAGPAVHETFDIPAADARYVRLDVLETSAPRGHIFQAVVHELEAFGEPVEAGGEPAGGGREAAATRPARAGP